MSTKAKRYISIACYVVGSAAALAAFVHWALQPDMTGMQASSATWPLWVGGIIMAIIGHVLNLSIQRPPTQ